MSLANYGRACMLSTLAMTFYLSPISGIWARAASTDWVKTAVDVTIAALYRLTIHICSDYTIRPNTNTLFGTKANM